MNFLTRIFGLKCDLCRETIARGPCGRIEYNGSVNVRIVTCIPCTALALLTFPQGREYGKG